MKVAVAHKMITLILRVLAILLFLMVAAIFFINTLPFEFFKARIDLWAAGNSVMIFDELFFIQVMGRLRVLSFAVLVAAVFLALTVKQVAYFATKLLRSFHSLPAKAAPRLRKIFGREEKVTLAILGVFITAGAAVRIFFLFQPMRMDEASTFLYSAARPLIVGLSYYVTPNNHLFHTLLLRLSYLTFGAEPWALRLPALIFGILLIPAAYTAARIYAGKQAALFAAGLVAASSALIEFSTNARGYTIICFIFLALLILRYFLQKSTNAAAWCLFALLAAAGLYTVSVAAYPLGLVTCYLFISIIRREAGLLRRALLKRFFLMLTAAGVLTVLLYLPVMVVSGWTIVFRNEVIVTYPWSTLAVQLPNVAFATWHHWNRDIPQVIQYFLLSAFLISLFFYRRLNLLLFSAVVIVAPLLALQRVIPPVRIWLFLLILYLLVASSGFSYLLDKIPFKKPGRQVIVATSLAVTLSLLLCLNAARLNTIVYSNETGTFRDAAAVTEFLKEELQPGDRLLAPFPSDTILEYYFFLSGMPSQCLWSDSAQSDRIIVVVNESFSHTLYEILENERLQAHQFFAPRIIALYPTATLYELQRK